MIVSYDVALPGICIFSILITLIERIASIMSKIQVLLIFKLYTYYYIGFFFKRLIVTFRGLTFLIRVNGSITEFNSIYECIVIS